ncbi:hypothetical protein [Shinella sp. BYT-45]|uniref:PD-(D/E)XK nuclease domain-containing protein n=1 Tax=Shinella sp. BYT-45 TaxID=3377377 RepID=UPI00397F2314
MVSLTRIAMISTAAVLESADAVLSATSRWPDTSTALASLTLTAAGLPTPRFAEGEVPAPTPAALRKTPELATYGYLLGRCDEATTITWLAAIDHLRGREIYPSDRQSFIYNPIEVLGIAAGLATLPDDDDNRTWFVNTLRRGFLAGHFRAPMSALGAHAAISLLDREGAAKINAPDTPFSEISTQELLLAAAIDFAFPSLATERHEELDHALQERMLSKGLTIGDAAEAAAAHVFAHRVNDRLLVPKALMNDLDLVLSLCRRFPLFADTMRARQRGRTPFGINDEYDVQDLLHAILRLHFDDIRPEEHTPSYAGNHSRVDFHLPGSRLVIEAKMTRSGLTQKEVINQLLIDVGRYSKMDAIDTLVCVIYDPDRHCTNPRGIETDVEKTGNRLNVKVVVCPQVLG